MSFVGHVFKPVNGGQNPKDGYHGAKYLGQTIHPQFQGQLIAEMEQCKRICLSAPDGEQGKNCVQNHNGQNPLFSLFSFLEFYRQQTNSRKNRKEYR